MNAFWKGRKKPTAPNRYKIAYANKDGLELIVIVQEKTEEFARKEFENYYSAPGDVITSLSLESEEKE